MPEITSATAFAPASIGNVGVGFDMLGLVIAGPGDRVTATRVANEGVRIREVRGLDGRVHAELSTNADDNTAGVAASALWQAHGKGGLELVVQKGIPLKSGMGSSAASAVAGCVAANALLAAPLPNADLLEFAIQGEKIASGSLHADNVAPSLLGGLVLCPPALHPRMIPLDVPEGISSVLLHPELTVSTAESRGRLAATYSLEQWLTQQGYLAGFITGLARNDLDLVRASLNDVIIEPQRASSVACFADVKAAAMAAGALGSSLSGSGPSIFALCENARADAVREAMEAACDAAGIEHQSWISPLDAPGALVEERH